MPKSFFILSKENLELAVDEIIAISKSYDRFSKVQLFSNVLILQSNLSWEKIVGRATFVKIAGHVLTKLSSLFLDENSFMLLQNARTFACRVINISSSKTETVEIEKSMGSMISKFSNAKVSLRDPDITVYLVIADAKKFFGISYKTKKLKRSSKIVKFPHELDQKLCRAMINLAGIKEKEVICDPFCGTGTILLEAESMGIGSIGIDFDTKMCHIAKQNVLANNFSSEIINADFRYLTKIQGRFDGVVTDVPYGKSSKISEAPKKLFEKFLSVIPNKTKLVIMCKNDFENNIKFKPTKKYNIYRHKSLTRTILVK